MTRGARVLSRACASLQSDSLPLAQSVDSIRTETIPASISARARGASYQGARAVHLVEQHLSRATGGAREQAGVVASLQTECNAYQAMFARALSKAMALRLVTPCRVLF